MADSNMSRIVEAMAEVLARRNQGEDIAPALAHIADAYEVSVEHLRERAEASWGSPIETDVARNNEHFRLARQCLEEQKQEAAKRETFLQAARDWAQDVWSACEPTGQPSWNYCCDRFLNANRPSSSQWENEARQIFLETGRKYNRARAKYLKANPEAW